ncbi:Protein of unknown function [Bacillus cereus]|nr:Protein of unknown function [Bacillus cereus]
MNTLKGKEGLVGE